MGRHSAYVIAAIVVIFFFMLISMFRGGRKETPLEAAGEPETPEEVMETSTGEVPIVSEMKTLAAQNPQQVANLIKDWVEEGGGS